MPDPVDIIPAPAPPREGSTMRRFLAERGVIIMRENRPIGYVSTTYGAPLKVYGQILAMVKDVERHVSVGVKFEQPETSTHISSAAFVDSDELDEFVAAFDFIGSAAQNMAKERRDYTEVTYCTRDDLTVGFYQDELKQQAFVRLGIGSPIIFFAITALATLRDLVIQARAHVNGRRPAWEAR